jgi:3-hydroxymyristoyl/3-hydroxydecanoyl-(acyl carrier protein) dehydratase
MMCAPIVRSVAAAEGQVTLQLDLPEDLPCFRGHYPGFPVLPGVVQIDWVMRLAAAHLQCSQPSATDFRIKFKRVIAPNSKVTLTLRHDAARRRLDFVYRSGDIVSSQGQVTLSAS